MFQSCSAFSQPLFRSVILIAVYLGIASCGDEYTGSDSEPQQAQAIPDYKTKKLKSAIKKIKGVSYLSDRLIKVSKIFVDSPYTDPALGEKDMIFPASAGPLYRGDAFNGTTFVETMSALAFARDFAGFKKLMNQIRYRGAVVDFRTRNHMPDADWTKNNVKEGFYDDMTSEFVQRLSSHGSPVELKNNKVNIDRQKWFAFVHQMDFGLEVETYETPYVKMTDLFRQTEEYLKLVENYAKAETKFVERIKAAITDEEKQVVRRERLRLVKNMNVKDWEGVTLIKENALAALPNAAVMNLVTLDYKILNLKEPDPKKRVVTEIGIDHQVLLVRDEKNDFVVRDASETWGKVVEIPLANYLIFKSTDKYQKGLQILTLKNRP